MAEKIEQGRFPVSAERVEGRPPPSTRSALRLLNMRRFFYFLITILSLTLISVFAQTNILWRYDAGG
jgi:hypothetical protein